MMKQTAFLIAAAFGLAAACCQAADAPKTLAEYHVAGGVKCESCHKQGTAKAPRQAECLACHGGSYAALAKQTEKVSPNPHYNHFGDRDCGTCHKGHEKPVLSCSECHKFKTLKMPLSE